MADGIVLKWFSRCSERNWPALQEKAVEESDPNTNFLDGRSSSGHRVVDIKKIIIKKKYTDSLKLIIGSKKK